MEHESNQSARLYGISKIPKFKFSKEITIANMKIWPIIDQNEIFIYHMAKIILKYLRHFCKSECSINNTKKFANMLYSVLTLQDDE